MKDDDPEKRIRELERQLTDVTPQSPPTYTEGVPYDVGAPPPPRSNPRVRLLILLMVAVLVPIIMSVVGFFTRSTPHPASRPPATTSAGPTAVPQGGELRVGGNRETRTIACNDGKLTLYGYGTKYSVTGHCASLTVGGYNNNVTVDSADTLESTGYGNTVTSGACNNGALKLSSYKVTFHVTGHCASLAITSYDNKVTVDSVDTIIVSGYNNDVTYHSGTPKVTDSGYSNDIQQG